jgi:YidC/Oxa1 family membrane protein insertase
MYYQTKLTPTAGSGQMAMMNTMMPILMLVFFYNMTSGLVLYWLVNTVMTIYQTWRIHSTAPATGGASSP